MKLTTLAPNQVTVKDDLGSLFFQSYDSIICLIDNKGQTYLDDKFWNYSKTTSKYRNQFLNETTKETQSKIDSGEYKLVNLN